MISINESFTSTVKMTDRSVVASCLLGFSNLGTGLSSGIAIAAPRPMSALPLSGLPVREGNERPTKALEAVAKAQAPAYAFAAAGAGSRKQQTTQHHTMWAFRGLEPWSDPA
ncbi:hypothetical protein [Streptomyces sp. NPDC059009]|uniref:hypothetical protein n=1 Tax=Streptomyces sp. NPDC059009 TaxID=3346694 RepID=UPI0036CA5500